MLLLLPANHLETMSMLRKGQLPGVEKGNSMKPVSYVAGRSSAMTGISRVVFF